MIKNITPEELPSFLENQFFNYMLFSSFGLILFFILIRPLINRANIPFYVQRRLTVTHEDKKYPINDLKFDTLPAIIYQSYYNESKLNGKLVRGINNNLANSEEFDNYFFNANDSRDYIESEFFDLLDIYDDLSIYEKNNLFIYCILYKKGGVYFDINLKLTKPLTQILGDVRSSIIFTKKSNIFIASSPGNPIFKELIDSYYTDTILKLSDLTLNDSNVKCKLDSNYNVVNSINDEIYFEQLNKI